MNRGSRQNIKSMESVNKIENNQNSSKYDIPMDVNQLIIDYLRKKNLEKSLDIFKKEVALITGPNTDREKLLKDFDSGNADSFFSNWSQFNSRDTQIPIIDDPKFEFYLRVYFLIYDIHPDIKNQKTVSDAKRQAFKRYLDTNGQDLARYSELVQYFAFPYITNFREHSSFKDIFSKRWIIDLREKLDKLLNSSINRMDTKLETLWFSAQSNTRGSQKRIASQNSMNDENLGYREKLEEMRQLNKDLGHKITQQEAESKETMKEIHGRWGNFVRYVNKRIDEDNQRIPNHYSKV